MKKIKKLNLLFFCFIILLTSCGLFGNKTPKQIKQGIMNYYKNYRMLELDLYIKQKNNKVKNIKEDLKVKLKIDSNKKIFANLKNQDFVASIYSDLSKLNSAKFYVNIFGKWNKIQQDLTQIIDKAKISGKSNEEKITSLINQLFERKAFTVSKENSTYVLATTMVKIKEELLGDFDRDLLKKDEMFNDDNKVEIRVDASNYFIKEIKLFNKNMQLNTSEIKKVNGEIKIPTEALNVK
ncbi:hypothetical protein [Helcococcus ovis]|uniref:hypothetical protein n=1 Tax=Helcococcus ovis TaxID=72026 RepID=UPI0038BAB5F7